MWRTLPLVFLAARVVGHESVSQTSQVAASILDTAGATKMTVNAKMKAEKNAQKVAKKKKLEQEAATVEAAKRAAVSKAKAEKEGLAQKVAKKKALEQEAAAKLAADARLKAATLKIAKQNAEAEARLAAKKKATVTAAKADIIRRGVGWGVPPDTSDHSSMHCGELKIRMNEMIVEGMWPIRDPAVRSAVQPCVNGMAGPYPCNGIDLLSFMPLSDFSQTEANDIWGWTDPETGKEYAMMGVLEGTVFVDVSDPVNPNYVVYVPTHTTASTWRDIKVYNNRAYIVSEAYGHGMQVYDLTRLRGITSVTQHSPDAHFGYFGNAHNLVINEDTARAYAVGSGQCEGGLVIMDITALAPQFLGCFSSDGYTHDAQCVVYNGPDSEHVGKEICAAFNEDTLTMVDVTNAANPRQLSRTPYSGASYTHQGWFDEAHEWIYANDELDESNFFGGPGPDPITKTLRFYAGDLDNVQFVDKYRHETESIDHNAYVHNGILYEANYCAGLRMLRIDGATGSLSDLAFFDTEQQCSQARFEGMWSVYPYFSSGTIVASSIEKGLFVLRAQPFTTPPPTPAPPPGAWLITGSGCEADGQCIQSNNYPSRYSPGECSVLLDSVPLVVEGFSTVPGDVLTLNGTGYSYRDAPPNGVYSGVMTWSADSSLETGWRLCRTDGGAPPTPPSPVPTPVPTPSTPGPTPTPTPPGNWELTGSGCTMSGDCISSLNYPSNYGNSESCTVQLYGDIPLAIAGDFMTEGRYDKLVVSGVEYHGTPPSNLADFDGFHTGSLTWSTDGSVVNKGWMICRTDGSAPTPTTSAPSPGPVPTPAPSPPGDCNAVCDRPSDCTNYPSICSGCSFC